MYRILWCVRKSSSRGRILESIYGIVNIKFYPKSNLRAITQIRSILKQVLRIAAAKFTTKFVITLRQGLSNRSTFMKIVCYNKVLCNNETCANNAFSLIYAEYVAKG